MGKIYSIHLVAVWYSQNTKNLEGQEPNVKQTQAKTSMGCLSRTHEKMFKNNH